MEKNCEQNIKDITKENYATAEPWPNNDIWHSFTYNILFQDVQRSLDTLHLDNTQIVLNAGCGKTSYITDAKVIYMDIVEKYTNLFENFLVGSIEHIPLPDDSVDCIICVGSVVNYADVQRAFSEFHRVLKTNGILILEFERANSAEFLFTKNYAKTLFRQKYHYNNQTHYLWMYNEKFTLQLAKYYNFSCIRKYRYHTLSSLLSRLGIPDERAAEYSRFDNILQPISYWFAHNEILTFRKNDP